MDVMQQHPTFPFPPPHSCVGSRCHSHTFQRSRFAAYKIYRCRICPHRGQMFCQLVEHVLRKHATKSNLHCQECPFGHSPYFTDTHAYLTHLSVTHKNNLAKHLCNIFSETPELPAILEVSTKISCIISH